ncbi:MAG: hypothetical protein ACRC0G_14810, partial [Fusobacteriaceae bacterium]
VVEIDESTAHRSVEFRKYYKEAFYEFGGKVRALLYDRALAGDTTACIYLDKVTNKTTEKNHDDNIELRKETLKLEREKVDKGLTTEPINITITKAGDK